MSYFCSSSLRAQAARQEYVCLSHARSWQVFLTGVSLCSPCGHYTILFESRSTGILSTVQKGPAHNQPALIYPTHSDAFNAIISDVWWRHSQLQSRKRASTGTSGQRGTNKPSKSRILSTSPEQADQHTTLSYHLLLSTPEDGKAQRLYLFLDPIKEYQAPEQLLPLSQLHWRPMTKRKTDVLWISFAS